VQPGSPAAVAGVTEGHEVLEVNGRAPRSLIEFNEMVCFDEDRRITLKTRSGTTETLQRVTMIPFEDLINERLGLSLVYLGNDSDTRYRIRGRPGFYITEVERRGPADRAGLKKGMLVVGLADQEARDLLTIANVVSHARSGESLTVTVVEPKRVGAGLVRYFQRGVSVKVR
jgi:S1-C subfamily serine protease